MVRLVLGGQLRYQLYSVTGNGDVYQQALYENGLSTIQSRKNFRDQTGIKNKANDVSFHLISHHGDVAVNADNGW